MENTEKRMFVEREGRGGRVSCSSLVEGIGNQHGPWAVFKLCERICVFSDITTVIMTTMVGPSFHQRLGWWQALGSRGRKKGVGET